jgi:phosphohistidine phosphatase SixA
MWWVSVSMAMLAAASLLWVPPAVGQPAGPAVLSGPELLAALRGGGFILYFRHADTDHRQNDTQMRSVEDCASQRNLTDRGREHARALGQAVRSLAIPIDRVLASPLCRTVETATLAFGAAERSDAARDPGSAAPGSPDRFPALRGLLSTVPPPGTNVVIVGHAYPFYSLVGGQLLDEGQAAVVRPGGTGFQVVARVGLREWRELLELRR